MVFSAKDNDGYLTEPAIEAMRSELAHSIFRQDFANLYEEQNQMCIRDRHWLSLPVGRFKSAVFL